MFAIRRSPPRQVELHLCDRPELNFTLGLTLGRSLEPMVGPFFFRCELQCQREGFVFASKMMKEDPERFRKHDATNEWGKYEHAISWLERVIAAFEAYPDGVLYCSV